MLALVIRLRKQAVHSEFHVVLPDVHCGSSEHESLLEQLLWSVEAQRLVNFYVHGADERGVLRLRHPTQNRLQKLTVLAERYRRC